MTSAKLTMPKRRREGGGWAMRDHGRAKVAMCMCGGPAFISLKPQECDAPHLALQRICSGNHSDRLIRKGPP